VPNGKFKASIIPAMVVATFAQLFFSNKAYPATKDGAAQKRLKNAKSPKKIAINANASAPSGPRRPAAPTARKIKAIPTNKNA
jgi:hypothetical protein